MAHETTFRTMTTDDLDGANGIASNADLDQFRRSCEAAMVRFDMNESEATAYVWGDGDFAKRATALLDEETLPPHTAVS